MTDAIISAMISGAVTLGVCVVTNHASAEKTRALLEFKIDELTKRVEKHNNVIERVYKLEQSVEDIKGVMK